ncbi:MAG: hypothetical protein AB7N80_11150 [Bdellovibrionales bacterium]
MSSQFMTMALALLLSVSAPAAFAVVLKTKPLLIRVTPAQNGSGILGQIDSTLLNRHLTKGNALYIFAGNVTPNDLGSAQPPLMVVPITQNRCVFSYKSSSLAAGTYTLAVTQQADTDLAGSDDNISFVATSTVNYANAAVLQTVDFATKSRILKVGAGKTYARPSLAIQNSANGDLIEIDSGEYVDDFASIGTNITIRGVGATRPHIRRANGVIPNGKGIWTTTGKVVIENVEISGSKVPDENGAAVRIENDTVVCNAYLHDNENGILGEGNQVMVEYSEIAFNGLTDVGFTHNIYIGAAGTFTLKYSYIHDAHDPNNTNDTGHNVKTRARNNFIFYNRIMNEAVGTAGDQINLPQGGLTYIVGNVIRDSARSSSNRTILYYDNGNDGAAHASLDLYMVNNTIVDDRGDGYLTLGGGAVNARVYNNLLFGNATTVAGQSKSNNIFSKDPAIFVDKTNYDFHIKAGGPAVNQGINPALISGFTIPVNSEYVHPAASKERVTQGALDAGAFEAP